MPPTALAAKSPSTVPIACDHEQEADVPERNGNDGPALQHDGSRFVGPKVAFYRMTQRARISLPGPAWPFQVEKRGRELPGVAQVGAQARTPHSRAYAASLEFGCARGYSAASTRLLSGNSSRSHTSSSASANAKISASS